MLNFIFYEKEFYYLVPCEFTTLKLGILTSGQVSFTVKAAIMLMCYST